eukprot:754178-Hanusia_phi.AAC.8
MLHSFVVHDQKATRFSKLFVNNRALNHSKHSPSFTLSLISPLLLPGASESTSPRARSPPPATPPPPGPDALPSNPCPSRLHPPAMQRGAASGARAVVRRLGRCPASSCTATGVCRGVCRRS